MLQSSLDWTCVGPMSGDLLETAQKKNKPRECEGLAGVLAKKQCKCPFVESHLADETLMKRLVACCSGWAHMQGVTPPASPLHDM